jgi:hypothetical protein
MFHNCLLTIKSLWNDLLTRLLPYLEGLPGGDIAKQLMEGIKAKKDFEELQALLNEISLNANGQTDDGDGMSCLLHDKRLIRTKQSRKEGKRK